MCVAYFSEVPLEDEILEHFVLLRRLQRHQVHAALAAKVAGVQPAHRVALQRFDACLNIFYKRVFFQLFSKRGGKSHGKEGGKRGKG